MPLPEYSLPVRIYLEDTDAQGIVYHANYLRYFERARSEILESLGIPVRNVATVARRYVVYEIRVKFRQPAALGDKLEVRSTMTRTSEYRLNFHQHIRRDGDRHPLVVADVGVVCINEAGKVTELPEALA